MAKMTKGLTFGAMLALWAGFTTPVMAQAVVDATTLRGQVEAALAAGVYTYAELKYGPAQIKLEAVAPDGQKTETVYGIGADGVSLVVLKSETEAARANDLGRSGLEVKSLTRDFVGGGRGDDDSDEDGRGRGRGGDDDGPLHDAGDDHGGDRGGSDDDGDDGDDDHGGDDRGGDHGGGDDHGGGKGGGHGSDDGGSDDGGSDDDGSDD